MKTYIHVKKLGLLSLAVILAGCATMSKDECRNADWQIRGLQDASEGHPLTRIGEHAKACARVSVVPNRIDYEAGHKKGARLYCAANNGYSEGRKGAAYNGICPLDLEKEFLRTYRDGQELFSLNKKIDRLSDKIDSNKSKIETNYDKIHDLKRDIIDSDSNSKERRDKLRRIDDLQNEIGEMETDLYRETQEKALFKQDLKIVEDKHLRMGYLK